MPDVVFHAGGKKYSSIKELTITKGLESLAHSFSFQMISDRSGSFPLKRGVSCFFEVDGKRFLTGYINQIIASFESKERTIEIQGRSRTADLIDCSWTGESDEFKGEHSLWSVASILCQPFNINVLLENNISDYKISNWKIDPGETIFESLERMARSHGLFWQTDEYGNIFICSVGKNRSDGVLIEGENITKGNVSWDDSDQFSEYHCLIQSTSTYDDEPEFVPEEEEDKEKPETNEMGYTLAKTQIAEIARDQTVKRFRPTVIFGEATPKNSDEAGSYALQRAQWDAAVRHARSFKGELTVRGWYQTTGTLWKVNEVAFFTSPSLLVTSYADVLITGVTFNRSVAQGNTTTVQITFPQAFKPQPAIVDKTDPASVALGY